MKLHVLNGNRDKSYTVSQSKWAFFQICLQMAGTMRRFLRDHDKLKSAYQTGYARLTTPDYWKAKLSLKD
jgi:hypothetical protein